VPNAKTHFPQIPLEIVKKIVEEENGEPLANEKPEQLRGPTKKKAANGTPSAQAKPEEEADAV